MKPTVNGYYWFRNHPLSIWRIVLVVEADTEDASYYELGIAGRKKVNDQPCAEWKKLEERSP